MRKILVFLFVVLSAGISFADNLTSWNLNEKIHPELKEDFAKMPDMNITKETLKEVRRMLAIAPETLPKDSQVEIHDEKLESGLRVRVYVPKIEAKELPGLLWIHGGGHITGMPEQDESLLIEIAKRAKCMIAAPDYRLAPEYKYPADLDDCMEALRWLAGRDNVNKAKIAVAGQSAGGGLTAAVTLRNRDEKGPALCFQMPLYSMLDYRNMTPSSLQITDHRVWNRDFNLAAWEMYLGSDAVKEGKISEYASPAIAADLSNLPPAYIMVGELDPFRDEAITYAQKLLQNGIPVELHVVPGAFHGFEVLLQDSSISSRYRNEYINALVNALKVEN